MIAVHGFSASGNCHKLRLLLEQLGREYRWIEIDSSKGETRTPAYLAKNPNGKVPMLELDDGRILAESNAILHYLAEGSPLLPKARWERAKVLQWLFFEQYSHEPCIAVSRFIRKYLPPEHPRRATLDALKASGDEALAAMERHLARLPWFGGERYSIADIALFAYTHVADEADFDLEAYPAIVRWMERIMTMPQHVGLDD